MRDKVDSTRGIQRLRGGDNEAPSGRCGFGVSQVACGDAVLARDTGARPQARGARRLLEGDGSATARARRWLASARAHPVHACTGGSHCGASLSLACSQRQGVWGWLGVAYRWAPPLGIFKNSFLQKSLGFSIGILAGFLRLKFGVPKLSRRVLMW